MKALVTGASDGIGKDISLILSSMGYHIIAVARSKDKMKNNFKDINNCTIIAMDLSNIENCYKLYNDVKDEDISIVVNNAGTGIFGEFSTTDLEKELNMIDLNIKALHILTKLFLNKFEQNNYGYILNVASIGGFFPSPLLSSYYATKSYVLNLTVAINEELRKNKSNVYIGAFCPATITTNFHKNAGANSSVKGLDSLKASQYAINKMFKKDIIIIPSYAKIFPFFISLLPKKLITKISYLILIKRR